MACRWKKGRNLEKQNQSKGDVMRFGRKGFGGTVALTIAFLMGSCGGGGGGGGGGAPTPPTPVPPTFDSATLVNSSALDSNIEVAFDVAMDAGSITSDMDGGECDGVIQVSKDDFSSCLAMSEKPEPGAEKKKFVINPSVDLDVQTSYKVKVTTGAKNSAGTALAADSVKEFTSRSRYAVSTVTVAAEDLIGGKAKSRPTVTVTFSGQVETISTNQSDKQCDHSFQLLPDASKDSNDNVCVPLGLTKVDGKTYRAVANEDLTANTVYAVRITADVLDDDNHALSNTPYIVSAFTTGTQPRIDGIDPSNDTVPDLSTTLIPNIKITFSEAMPTTVTAGTPEDCTTGSVQLFKETDPDCVKMSSGTLSDDNRTFTMTPAGFLDPTKKYRLKLSKTIKNAFDFPLPDTQTGDRYGGFFVRAQREVTGVLPNTDKVTRNSAIKATFNGAIDPTKVIVDSNGGSGSCDNGATFLVTTGSNCVAMYKKEDSYDSNDHTFTIYPRYIFDASTTHNITIKTGLLDNEGAAIAREWDSTFDTLSEGITANPANNTPSVVLDTTIDVTFVNDMSSDTITAITGSAGDDATDDCSGSVQISNDGFSSCAKMKTDSKTTSDNKKFTFKAARLLPDATYQIRVTPAAKENDASAASAVDSEIILNGPKGFDTILSPTVVSMTKPPPNATTDIEARPEIEVEFSRNMKVASITTNTDDTNCEDGERFLVSSESGDFSDGTCIQMAGDPTNDNPRFSITPKLGSDLSADTIYRVKIKKDVTDDSGFDLNLKSDRTFTFKTASAPKFKSWSLPDATTNIRYTTAIRVVFDSSFDISRDSVTITDSTDTCGDEAFAVSKDGFNKCVVMSGIDASGDMRTFTIIPKGHLDPSTDYIARVTKKIKNIKGFSLPEKKELSFKTASEFKWRLPDTGYTKNDPDVSDDDGEVAPRYPLSFTDDGNSGGGVVIDNNTGLIWQNRDLTSYETWLDASKDCDAYKNITLGLNDGWRLPTVHELMQIVDFGKDSGKAINAAFAASADFYWTRNTLVGDDKFGYVVHFKTSDDGIVNAVTKTDSSTAKYRCVHE